MKIFLLLIFWSHWFLCFCSRFILAPVLPLIETEMSITHGLAGSLFFFVSFGFTSSMLLAGFISKYVGYKRAIVSSFILLVLVLISYFFTRTYIQMAVVSLLIGFGTGIYLPCAVPLITSFFSRKNWGKVIGIHETAASSSFLLIPIMVAIELRFFDWRAVFVILSGAALLVTLLMVFFVPDLRPPQEAKGQYRNVLRNSNLWLFPLLWSTAAMISAGMFGLMPLFLVEERGLQLEMANTLVGLSRIGGLFATILLGFILDRYNPKRILMIILLTSGIATIGLALVKILWLLVGMLIFQATISVLFFPTGLLFLSQITSIEERSTFTGITLAISSIIGAGIAPAGLGALADHWNFETGFCAAGIITILSCLLFRKIKTG